MKGRALGLALVLALLIAVPAPVAAGTPDGGASEHVLVHFATRPSEADMDRVARAVGGTVDGTIAQLRIARVRLGPGDDVGAAIAVLARQPDVVLVERDVRVSLDLVPNDTYWAGDPFTPALGEWGLRATKVDQAWDLVKASRDIIVAVVDTGIDDTHPDLAGAVVPGVAYVSAPSEGCDVTTKDENSHGTHVAGIIAAIANNGIGIAGAASGVRVMPIRSLDCTGIGSTSDIAMGVTWAVDHGARIVTISLGASLDSATLEEAVQYAIGHGVLVIAASGNCGLGPPRCLGTANLVEYPAAYPGVLAVGATEPDGTIAPFSTQGAHVGIAAPGVRIVSTTPRYATYQSLRGLPMDYASLSGTSQATPLVAAVAALVWSADPTLIAAQVIERLEETADDLGVRGRDPAYGSGMVNAFRAVSASLRTFGARYDTTSAPTAATTGATFTAAVKVTNTSAGPWRASDGRPVKLGYHWIDAKGSAVVWDGTRTALGVDVAPGATTTVDARVTAPATAGGYTLRFDLVRDGVAWFSERGVVPGDASVRIGTGLGATYATSAEAATYISSDPAPLDVTLTNTGARPWAATGEHPVRLSYHWIAADGGVAVWDGARAAPFTADVQPGQTVSVKLPLVAPPRVGRYTLRLDLVEEGMGWFSGDGVATRDIGYVMTTGLRAAYGGIAPGALLAGASTQLTVAVTNTGVAPWPASGDHPVRLSYHWFAADGSVAMWDGGRAQPFAADIAPGETVRVELPLAAPTRSGRYTLRLDLVQEGIAWFSDDGVVPGDAAYTVTTGLDASYDAVRAGVLVADLPASLPITLTNTGTRPWPAAGAHPVRISYHWIDAEGALAVWDGLRAPLSTDVAPGQTLTVRLPIAAPPDVGRYVLRVDLVQEGVGWLSGDGVAPHAVAFLVTRRGVPSLGPVYPVDPRDTLAP